MVDQVTQDHLPIVSICGHSNADGWGKSDSLFADFPELKPIRPLSSVVTDLQQAYWKHIFVATSPQPLPGPSHTPVTALASDVAWLELTIANIKQSGDPHPHTAAGEEYAYPNNRGSCYPRYFYNAWIVAGFDGFHHDYRQVVTFDYDGEASGPFVVGEPITFGSPTASGVLVFLDDQGASGIMTVVLDYSSALPVDNSTITGGTSGATADVFGVVSVADPKIEGTLVGIEIPLMVAWRDHWGSQVGLAKVAFSSTLFLPQEQGPPPSDWLDPNFGGGSPSSKVGVEAVPNAVDTSLGEQYAYWSPRLMFDWSPSTARIYRLWAEKLLGAKAALPAGKHLDVQLLLNWFGDNDALTRSREYLESSFKAACVAMIRAQRAFLAKNELSTLPAEQIPVVWMKVHKGYNGLALAADFAPVDFCNQCLEEIATDDPYVRLIDTDDLTLLSEEGDVPPLGMGVGTTHLSHNGYVEASKLVMEAWRDIRQASFDAIADADRVTVEDAIAEVRARYDRGGTTSSDVRDDAAERALNNAIRHVVNCAGDSCWWLNQTLTMRLTFNSDGVASMPRYVARVLEIRDVATAKKKLQFRQIGFGDGGRCQIVLENEDAAGSGTGTYRVEHVRWPLPVSTDQQLLPIPRQLLEWVVVEACKRVASGSDNVAKFAMLNGEAAAIEARAMRQIARQSQAQRDAMQYGRPRVTLRY